MGSRRSATVPGTYRTAPRRALGWLACASLALWWAPRIARADAAAAIEGIVVDATTGAPIPTATISIAGAKKHMLLRTDAAAVTRPMDPLYRDCSPPDLARIDREPWVRAPGTTFQAVRVDGNTDLLGSMRLHARDCRAGDAEGCTNLAMLCAGVPAATGEPPERRARAEALCARVSGAGAATAP